jgi:hypothetical protein
LDIPFKYPFGYVFGGFSFHGFRGSFGTFALHFTTPLDARLTVVFNGIVKTVMIANGHGHLSRQNCCNQPMRYSSLFLVQNPFTGRKGATETLE